MIKQPDVSAVADENSCLTCGACCGFFRVSFYWAEADDGGGVTPTALTEPLSLLMRNMRGTNSTAQCRCCALQGNIGQSVTCSIYEQRPSPCREFSRSGEKGVDNEACNRARARYGLAPLTTTTFTHAEADIQAMATCNSTTEQVTMSDYDALYPK